MIRYSTAPQLRCLPVRGGTRGNYVYEVSFPDMSYLVNGAFAAWMMRNAVWPQVGAGGCNE